MFTPGAEQNGRDGKREDLGAVEGGDLYLRKEKACTFCTSKLLHKKNRALLVGEGVSQSRKRDFQPLSEGTPKKKGGEGESEGERAEKAVGSGYDKGKDKRSKKNARSVRKGKGTMFLESKQGEESLGGKREGGKKRGFLPKQIDTLVCERKGEVSA